MTYSFPVLQEGIHDPYIFKAIFMAGAPGSGKSTVRNQLFGGLGLKLVDADEVRRAYMEQGKSGDYEEYGRIVRKQRENYATQRLGIIMDTTAWWSASVEETTRQLRSLGYDVAMIHVFVPLHQSVQRANTRAELTGRHVPEPEIIKRYQGLQDNIRDYANWFGDQFWFVDNTGNKPKLDLVKREIHQWLKQPPSSAIAKSWMQSQHMPLKENAPPTKARKVSAAVIITDGQHILLGHVTGSADWDIPKGGIDVGETPVQAAVRELREETGLRVNPTELKYLGRSAYHERKDLEMFLWRVDHMPHAHALHCTSLFQDSHSKEWLPELDDFAVVPISQALDLVNPNLERVLLKYSHLFQSG